MKNNSKVEIKTREGKKIRGSIIDLARGGVIVLLDDGRTLGVPQQFIDHRLYPDKGTAFGARGQRR